MCFDVLFCNRCDSMTGPEALVWLCSHCILSDVGHGLFNFCMDTLKPAFSIGVRASLYLPVYKAQHTDEVVNSMPKMERAHDVYAVAEPETSKHISMPSDSRSNVSWPS